MRDTAEAEAQDQPDPKRDTDLHLSHSAMDIEPSDSLPPAGEQPEGSSRAPTASVDDIPVKIPKDESSGPPASTPLPADKPPSQPFTARDTPAPDVEVEYDRRKGPTVSSGFSGASRPAVSSDADAPRINSRAANLPARGKPHGAAARRYLNELVTPHLLEGMKYLALSK